MTKATHTRLLNGFMRGPLLDDVRPYPDQIRHSLNSMNGTPNWAYSLWRGPEDADPSEEQEYMQCAGTADAMTIEVRTLDPGGTAQQHTVGRPGGDYTAGPTEVIRWNDGRDSTTVYPSEVFTADEAADVFYAYFLTDKVAAPYVLRELDMTWPPAAKDDREMNDRMSVEIERLDAHPGDLHDRSKNVEGDSDFMLSGLLPSVLEPFLDRAPQAMWICRGKSRGQWRDFAEVVTFGPADRLGARLLVRDQSLRSFVGTTETTLQITCRPEKDASVGGRPAPHRSTARRRLLFSDNNEIEQEWLPDSSDPALDEFFEFIGRQRGEDNWTFSIEDEEAGDGLMLMFEFGLICRAGGGQSVQTGYRLVTDDSDYRALVNNFIRGGFTALDLDGPWWPEFADVARAAFRFGFEGSVLRQTHPRELRRRLETLTSIDGREPITLDGITHYGFGNGGGDSVNAWFTVDGRGLVTTFDHASALWSTDDPRANAALYDGVPADLLDLVRNVPNSVITPSVPHPDGGTLVAATGIFTFSGPSAIAEGVVTRLQATGLGIEDTGIDRLLTVFLETEEFTPAAVEEAVDWWSADGIASGFAATAAREQARLDVEPLDRAAVDRFRAICAGYGYNDQGHVHYVLFDSRTLEQAGETRDELLSLIETLGLERVDAPPRAATGEVWVRTDPRIDTDLVTERPATALESSLLEIGIQALSFHWSDAESRAFRSPPYPLPAGLIPLLGQLQAALPADSSAGRLGKAYVPSSSHYGHGVMARDGLPRVLLDLLTHGTLSTADGERLVDAAGATDLPARDRELVVRGLLLRLIEVNLTADDVAAAEVLAALVTAGGNHYGWREIASYHAAKGNAVAFFRNWTHYDASRDRAEMQRLKSKLIKGVAAREGWQAAIEVCGDKRIGDDYLLHAFEPPAYGYDDLVTLFAGDASGVLPEADELHCLVAAAVAESQPQPVADHRGVEVLLARISALEPKEGREAMRARDHLLSTLHRAIGSEDTLASLRKQIRTPRLRSEALHLFTGPSYGIRTDGV